MLANYCFLLLVITQTEFLLGNADIYGEAESLFHDYWEFTVTSAPEYATMIGDHRFNDKLNNYSVAHYENCKVKLNKFYSTAKDLLKIVERESDTHTNLEAFVAEVQHKLDLLDIKSYLLPISYLDGPPSSLIRLLRYVPMTSTNDFEKLVSRYNALPQQVDEIIDLMKEGIRSNIVAHERSMKDIEKRITSSIVEAKWSFFYKPFQTLSSFVSKGELENYEKLAEESIAQSLNPALQKLADFIQNEYRQHLRPNIAVTSLPNGEEFYRKTLNYFVTSNVTSQEIHDMGLREVRRISKEMDTLITSLSSNLDKLQFNEQLRSNASMFFRTKEEALSVYNDFIRNKIEPQLPNYFKKLPKAKIQIKPVPEELCGGPLAFYNSATPDGSINGTFFLDLSNLSNLPKYQTATLALHEAYPGHHLQNSYILEQEDGPMFRRRVQYPLNAACLEGWALYSEYLGNEMNLFEDKYMLYGHLSESIFRACRLVVDTGIHALGWSREQAIDFMLENSASSEGNVRNEVDRYITWPGQACSYKFGEIKIKTLRAKVEAALGNRFDLKDFHDVVLRSSGSLSFLEKQVDDYITKHKELNCCSE